MNEPYHYVVVGGGSAGMICASYLKTYWKHSVKVTVVYDHKNPGIGVGESLTPVFYDYLNFVGITREELIREVNATVKLGLKFKNWMNDGKYFYHNFQCKSPAYNLQPYEFIHEIITDQYSLGTSYSPYMLETCRIPSDRYATQSVHIDATLFSKFVEQKFKNDIEIIDGIITSVVVDTHGINKLILSDGREISGDFFIDSSGFQSLLMKNLENEWVDKSSWLPINKCIPNPLPWEFNYQPPYTTSEATEEGWILQVPLSNRWGTGYLYSSDFLSDEKAFENFEIFLNKNFNSSLNNTSKVLNFKSGYWKNQWVKNCICVGLSSGFAEPLEATNIHHTIDQIISFVDHHNATHFISPYSIKEYNKKMADFYYSTYLYLRFCYDTNRTDSEFWKYITSSTPEDVKEVNHMLQNGLVTSYNLPGRIFSFINFIMVGYGQGKINKEAWKNEIYKRGMHRRCINSWHELINYKWSVDETSLDHLQYIKSIKPR
jgi:tryptophan halogenase